MLTNFADVYGISNWLHHQNLMLRNGSLWKRESIYFQDKPTIREKESKTYNMNEDNTTKQARTNWFQWVVAEERESFSSAFYFFHHTGYSTCTFSKTNLLSCFEFNCPNYIEQFTSKHSHQARKGFPILYARSIGFGSNAWTQHFLTWIICLLVNSGEHKQIHRKLSLQSHLGLIICTYFIFPTLN